MADSTNTTVLVIAAAAVVVAVMWSRRASAAPAGAGAAGRRPSAPDRKSDGTDWGDVLRGAGSLFSGIADLSREFSSDEESVYTIPSNGGSDRGLLGADSFVGEGCSADYNCGFGEICYLGKCMSEDAFVQMEREKLDDARAAGFDAVPF